MGAISRNCFISSTFGALAALPLGAYAQVRQAPPLARVNVDPARVIRTVVGLRPFRLGFVLRGGLRQQDDRSQLRARRRRI